MISVKPSTESGIGVFFINYQGLVSQTDFFSGFIVIFLDTNNV